MSKIDTNAPLIQKTREMIKLLNVYLNHFPKHEKYGLCQQMRACAYEVYGLIVEGLKRYHKKTALTQLDIARSRNFTSNIFSRARNAATTIGFRNTLVADTKSLGPFFCVHGVVANSNHNTSPLVSQLIATQHPLAVIWRVVAVIVNPIKSVLRRRRLTHVRNKIVVRSTPPLAHLDPSPPVVVIARVVRVFAALNHAAPAAVDRIVALSFRLASGFRDLFVRFFAQAAAGLHVAVNQVCGWHRFLRATVASALPGFAPVAPLAFANNQQFSKALASQVELFWHSSLPRLINARTITLFVVAGKAERPDLAARLPHLEAAA